MTDHSKLFKEATALIKHNGWEPGQKLGLMSVISLMEQFAGIKLDQAAEKSANLLKGYDTGDDGFGVEEAIRTISGRPKVFTPCTWCHEIHQGACARLISGGQSD